MCENETYLGLHGSLAHSYTQSPTLRLDECLPVVAQGISQRGQTSPAGELSRLDLSKANQIGFVGDYR